MLYVKNASAGELGMIMEIYSAARESMVRTGNPTQWGCFYPSEELVANDIRQGICYVIHDEDQIYGVFALCTGEEPTYREIYDGAWLNDQPYVTIHRIAADGKAHGIFHIAADFAKQQADNIRIDTHENNLIMQRLIKKHGFVRCGTIYVHDGSPRLAYQWTNTFLKNRD